MEVEGDALSEEHAVDDVQESFVSNQTDEYGE